MSFGEVEFRQGAELRRELGMVNVNILGKLESGFFIAEVHDIRTGSVNDLFTPGHNAKISGWKLKVDGQDASCGVYFVSETDGTLVKVDSVDIVENVNPQSSHRYPPADFGNLPARSNHLVYGRRQVPDPRRRTVVFDRLLSVVAAKAAS